jgi:hypothetical protein
MADLHRAFLLPWLFTRSTFILALMEGNEVMSQCYHQAPSMENIYKVNSGAPRDRVRIEGEFRAFPRCPTALHIYV